MKSSLGWSIWHAHYRARFHNNTANTTIVTTHVPERLDEQLHSHLTDPRRLNLVWQHQQELLTPSSSHESAGLGRARGSTRRCTYRVNETKLSLTRAARRVRREDLTGFWASKSCRSHTPAFSHGRRPTCAARLEAVSRLHVSDPRGAGRPPERKGPEDPSTSTRHSAPAA